MKVSHRASARKSGYVKPKDRKNSKLKKVTKARPAAAPKSKAELKAIVHRCPLQPVNQQASKPAVRGKNAMDLGKGKPPSRSPEALMDTDSNKSTTGHQNDKDAQLVSSYASEIFDYLVSLEPSQAVRADFLRSPVRLTVTPRMRSVLFDWLVQVHLRFALQSETLYLTLHIVDYYMSRCRVSDDDNADDEIAAPPARSEYQLLGISAMFLAAKYEEVCPPEIADFAYLSDDAYTEEDIRRTERDILKGIGYFLGYPLPVQYLRRFGHACSATQSEHELAKYLTELGVSAYSMAHLPPSGLAASAVCLARCLLRPKRKRPAGGRVTRAALLWTPGELEAATGYSGDSLRVVVRALAKLAVMAADRCFGAAVRKKYSGLIGNGISVWPEVSRENPTLLALSGEAAGLTNGDEAADRLF